MSQLVPIREISPEVIECGVSRNLHLGTECGLVKRSKSSIRVPTMPPIDVLSIMITKPTISGPAMKFTDHNYSKDTIFPPF